MNKEFQAQIELALSVALQDPKSFEQADKMYRQTFRSAPYLASEFLSILQDNWNNATEIQRKMCMLEPKIWFKSKTGYTYDERLMVCDLCNYKGEGDGDIVVFDATIAKLPVFVSKENSFSLF
jgi:hypothetical protein